LRRLAARNSSSGGDALARRYVYPGCHPGPPYSTCPAPELPVTDAALEQCLSLPTGTAVSVEDIAMVDQIVRLAVSDPAEVRRHLVG
jgi:dTDP-4-amino-4,6-dideoxygalactose transaminase